MVRFFIKFHEFHRLSTNFRLFFDCFRLFSTADLGLHLNSIPIALGAKMMKFVLNNEGFCIKNEKFRTKKREILC